MTVRRFAVITVLALAVALPTACSRKGSRGGPAPAPSAGSLRFSSASFAGAEPGGPVAITVQRVGGTAGAVGVSYATSDGTATAGADYTAASGTLSWADGDSSDKTFTVTVLDDGAVEGDETVGLALSLPTGGASLGSPSTATLTIADNDVPSAGAFQFSSATYSIIEDGGMATITVTRTGGTAGPVTVDYATSNGSATAGADYTAASGTLAWGDGDASDKTFAVTILDDAFVETNETINLALSNPTGGAVLGTQDTAVLTITDDDAAGTLQFSSAAYTVSETGVTATITATRASGSGGVVTVDYATSNGTATAGADYTAASGTLAWADGDVSPKTFTVTILDDPVQEGDETVNLALSNPTGGATIGTPGAAILTIVENDVAGTLQFASASFTIGEAGPTATIAVTRAGGSSGAVTVDWSVTGGTATPGADYVATPGTLSWADGDAADKTFTIAILEDGLLEGNETGLLGPPNPPGGATLGSPAAASLTILDNDVPGTLQFSSAAYSVDEGAGSATITVTRAGGTGGAVTVDYATADGTAIAGADYATSTGTLSWSDGDAAPKSFTVPITNDVEVEGNETVDLALSNPTGGATLGSPTAAVLTITDNDFYGTIQFSSATYSVNESGGTATITATRAGGTAGAVGVSYATIAGGTASAPQDYIPTAGTLAWADGDAADKTFTVTIVDNLLPEPDETVNLELSLPTGGATLGTPVAAVLTILDDDSASPGTLQFSSATYVVTEDGGTATITVTRNGGTSGLVTVDYATVPGGTATPGSDFTPASGTLGWLDGDATPKTFSVTILDDLMPEAAETVNLALTNPTGGATLGAPNTAVLTINDNDAAPGGTLQFSSATYTVAEDAGTVTITVTRAGGTAGFVTVDYATTLGTAMPTWDFTPKSGTLGWANGDGTPKTFTVTILDDIMPEGDEFFGVKLSNPTGGAMLGTPETATVTILDNDPAPGGFLQFSQPTYTVTENGLQATITVTRTVSTSGAVTVDYATVPGGSATPLQDYTPTFGTLMWADGDGASKTFTVTIIDDLLVELSETVNLALSNPTGGAALGTPNTATLTITDND